MNWNLRGNRRPQGKANCNNTWNTPYRSNDCANEGRGKLTCIMPSAANRRAKLNAMELNEETGMYCYGARYYEPRLSLWMSCDPMQEKYPNISSYCYTYDNPIKFIDPDGRIVKIPKNQNQIIGYINQKAQGVFAVNKKNELYFKIPKDTKGYSKYYTEKLIALINGPNSTVTVRIDQKVKEEENGKSIIKDVDKDHGGGVTTAKAFRNNKTGKASYDVNVIISGNANDKLKDQEDKVLEDEAADILYHEIVGHAAPKVLGTDTGNAINNENKIRKKIKTFEEGGS